MKLLKWGIHVWLYWEMTSFLQRYLVNGVLFFQLNLKCQFLEQLTHQHILYIFYLVILSNLNN